MKGLFLVLVFVLVCLSFVSAEADYDAFLHCKGENVGVGQILTKNVELGNNPYSPRATSGVVDTWYNCYFAVNDSKTGEYLTKIGSDENRFEKVKVRSGEPLEITLGEGFDQILMKVNGVNVFGLGEDSEITFADDSTKWAIVKFNEDFSFYGFTDPGFNFDVNYDATEKKEVSFYEDGGLHLDFEDKNIALKYTMNFDDEPFYLGDYKLRFDTKDTLISYNPTTKKYLIDVPVNAEVEFAVVDGEGEEDSYIISTYPSPMELYLYERGAKSFIINVSEGGSFDLYLAGEGYTTYWNGTIENFDWANFRLDEGDTLEIGDSSTYRSEDGQLTYGFDLEINQNNEVTTKRGIDGLYFSDQKSVMGKNSKVSGRIVVTKIDGGIVKKVIVDSCSFEKNLKVDDDYSWSCIGFPYEFVVENNGMDGIVCEREGDSYSCSCDKDVGCINLPKNLGLMVYIDIEQDGGIPESFKKGDSSNDGWYKLNEIHSFEEISSSVTNWGNMNHKIVASKFKVGEIEFDPIDTDVYLSPGSMYVTLVDGQVVGARTSRTNVIQEKFELETRGSYNFRLTKNNYDDYYLEDIDCCYAGQEGIAKGERIGSVRSYGMSGCGLAKTRNRLFTPKKDYSFVLRSQASSTMKCEDAEQIEIEEDSAVVGGHGSVQVADGAVADASGNGACLTYAKTFEGNSNNEAGWGCACPMDLYYNSGMTAAECDGETGCERNKCTGAFNEKYCCSAAVAGKYTGATKKTGVGGAVAGGGASAGGNMDGAVEGETEEFAHMSVEGDCSDYEWDYFCSSDYTVAQCVENEYSKSVWQDSVEICSGGEICNEMSCKFSLDDCCVLESIEDDDVGYGDDFDDDEQMEADRAYLDERGTLSENCVPSDLLVCEGKKIVYCDGDGSWKRFGSCMDSDVCVTPRGNHYTYHYSGDDGTVLRNDMCGEAEVEVYSDGEACICNPSNLKVMQQGEGDPTLLISNFYGTNCVLNDNVECVVAGLGQCGLESYNFAGLQSDNKGLGDGCVQTGENSDLRYANYEYVCSPPKLGCDEGYSCKKSSKEIENANIYIWRTRNLFSFGDDPNILTCQPTDEIAMTDEEAFDI